MGVDFVVKHGSHSSLQAGCPVAVVVQSGRYVYGEVAEQWRSEGHCEQVPLIDIMHVLPEYTVAHMVAAKRMEAEEATDEKPVCDKLFGGGAVEQWSLTHPSLS